MECGDPVVNVECYVPEAHTVTVLVDKKRKRYHVDIVNHMVEILEERLADAIQFAKVDFESSGAYSNKINRIVSRNLRRNYAAHVQNLTNAIASDLENDLIQFDGEVQNEE